MSHKPSGFGNGMAFGFLFGLGAFYLVGTDKGKDLQKKLVADFEAIKKQMEENGTSLDDIITEAKSSISDQENSPNSQVSQLKSVLGSLSKQLEQHKSKQATLKPGSKSTAKKPKASKPKKKTFKRKNKT